MPVPSSGEGLAVGPSPVFVVAGPAEKAAVEDTDEPVGDDPERLGAAIAGASPGVVERPSAG